MNTATYDLARRQAVLFNVSNRAKIELRGHDRASFLHNFCTQDIKALGVGQGCSALILNLQAKILACVRIFAREQSLWIDSEPDLGPKIRQHLDRYLISEQVELLDCTTEYAQLRLAGPQAASMLMQLVQVDLASWKPLQHADLEIAGVMCQVRRDDSLSVPSFDLIFAATHQRALHEALNLPEADGKLHEVLRIEAGTPVYGTDVDESNLPQELGRDAQLISFTKGCYLGQEPVVRIRDLGHVNRQLGGLKLAGADVPAAGSKVARDGKEIGHITSSAFSPTVGSAIALGYLRRGHQQIGTTVQVGAQAAAVAALPLVKSASPQLPNSE
jgi:folate-binding protein YgfZ